MTAAAITLFELSRVSSVVLRDGVVSDFNILGYHPSTLNTTPTVKRVDVWFRFEECRRRHVRTGSVWFRPFVATGQCSYYDASVGFLVFALCCMVTKYRYV